MTENKESEFLKEIKSSFKMENSLNICLDKLLDDETKTNSLFDPNELFFSEQTLSNKSEPVLVNYITEVQLHQLLKQRAVLFNKN